MKEVGLEFPPEKKVRFLSAAHKQLIQIAKALNSLEDFNKLFVHTQITNLIFI